MEHRRIFSYSFIFYFEINTGETKLWVYLELHKKYRQYGNPCYFPPIVVYGKGISLTPSRFLLTFSPKFAMFQRHTQIEVVHIEFKKNS